MSKQAVIVYQHVDHPEWGRGVVVNTESGRTDRFDITFEKGGRRTILKSYSAKLTPVIMPTDEAKVLGDKLANRRSPAKATGSKKPRASTGAPIYTTFEAQLKYFEDAFPGGFRGDKYERDVRGGPNAKRRKTDTGAAVADAAEFLSEASFDSHDEAWIFEHVSTLLRTTSFVHPLEGANSLGTIKAEHRSEFVQALRDLLHGTGDEADRFDRFVDAVKLEDANGNERRPTWPLTTVLNALVHPEQHVCVKPTFFQRQAELFKVPLDYQPRPDSSVYGRFLNVTRKTEEALRAAGQDPRDLVDVHSFICFTQSAKPDAKD